MQAFTTSGIYRAAFTAHNAEIKRKVYLRWATLMVLKKRSLDTIPARRLLQTVKEASGTGVTLVYCFTYLGQIGKDNAQIVIQVPASWTAPGEGHVRGLQGKIYTVRICRCAS